MRAAVGDHIVLASNSMNGPRRDCEVLQVRHGDGTPPYLVQWGHNQQVGLLFPGLDAHVQQNPMQLAGGRPEAPTRLRARHWRVDVELYQWDDDTTAHAVLFADDPEQLDGRGHAHRHPRDRKVAAIGDEVAVARALTGLAARLLGAASDDLSNVTGHPVQLRA